MAKKRNGSYKRKIDESVSSANKRLKSKFVLVPSMKIKTWKALIVIMFMAGFAVALVWSAVNGWYVGSNAEVKNYRLKNLMQVGSLVRYDQINTETMEKVKNSPFDSYAVVLTSWQDEESANAPDIKHFRDSMAAVKTSQKKVWPRIMMSRMFGHLSKCSPPTTKDGKKYLDLWDTGKCTTDFKDMFRLALKIAKQTNSGGIAIDAEMYEAYYNNRVSNVGKGLRRTEDKVRARLDIIGKELADIVKEEYPGAIIWFLSTSPTHQAYTEDKYPERIPDYIVRKMAGESIEIVDGGFFSLGYTHPNLQDLTDKLNKRSTADLRDFMAQNKTFHLGGTIMTFLNVGTPKNPGVNPDFISRFKLHHNCDIFAECNQVKKSVDFIPLLQELFRTQEYVWIYQGHMAIKQDFDDLYYYPEPYIQKYRNLIMSGMRRNGICEESRNENCQTSPADCGVCPPSNK